MLPVVIAVSDLADSGEFLDMANFIMIEDYQENVINSNFGVVAVKIEDTENAVKVKHGAITAGNSASVELLDDDVDYQTTGTAKVVLIIQGSATTLTDFEVIEDTTVNLGTGTQKQDLSSISVSGTKYITTKVISIAANKFITLKVNTGNITQVNGWVIE